MMKEGEDDEGNGGAQKLEEFAEFYKKARSTFGAGISLASLWFVFKVAPHTKITRVGGHDDSRGDLEGGKVQKGGGASGDMHGINQGKGWSNWVNSVLEKHNGTDSKITSRYRELKKLCKDNNYVLDKTHGVKRKGGSEKKSADKSKQNPNLGKIKEVQKKCFDEEGKLYTTGYSIMKDKYGGKKLDRKTEEAFEKSFKAEFADDLEMDIEADDEEDLLAAWEEHLADIRRLHAKVAKWASKQEGPAKEEKPEDHKLFDGAYNHWVDKSGAKGSGAKEAFKKVWSDIANNAKASKAAANIAVESYDKDGKKISKKKDEKKR